MAAEGGRGRVRTRDADDADQDPLPQPKRQKGERDRDDDLTTEGSESDACVSDFSTDDEGEDGPLSGDEDDSDLSTAGETIGSQDSSYSDSDPDEEEESDEGEESESEPDKV